MNLGKRKYTRGYGIALYCDHYHSYYANHDE